MRCQRCGFDNQKGANFCEQCGRDLTSQQQGEEEKTAAWESAERLHDSEKEFGGEERTMALQGREKKEERTMALHGREEEEDRTMALHGREEEEDRTMALQGREEEEDRTMALHSQGEEEDQTMALHGQGEEKDQTMSLHGQRRDGTQTEAIHGSDGYPPMSSGGDGYPWDGGDWNEKRCSNCGALVDADSRYCPVCGFELPSYGPGPGHRLPQDKSSQTKQKSSLTKQILLVLLVLFLLIDAILAGYYIYKKGHEESQDETAESQEEQDGGDGQEEGEDAAEAEPTATPKPEIVHIYDYFLDDCSWEEAYQKCKSKGGYLVRIESAEEFEKICQEIRVKGMQNYMFFIGARRDPGTSSYYWIDGNNVVMGEPINDSNAPLNSYWMSNEPSYRDGSIEETCMMMNYYSGEGRWVINDVPNELTDVVPQYEGKIGYICEYEMER